MPGVVELLGRRGCNEILVEAGARVSGAFLSAGLVDEIVIYSSPDVLGSDGRGIFELPGIQGIDDRVCHEILDVSRMGRDLKIVYRRTGERAG